MAQRQWRSDDTDAWQHAFGGGGDGASYTVPANEGCSGTGGGTALTLAAAGGFADGDLVLIHQTRGTGAGNWELNKIASGGGTTSLTMEHDLIHTYTDSGTNQAQIIELKEYEDITISTTVNAPAWDGSKGGIIAFLDKGKTTISGSLNAKGLGFRLGTYGGSSAYCGEGTATDRTTNNNPSGNSGGGNNGNQGGGAGGGHGTAGGNDTLNRAYGGSTSGTASLVTMTFGGAGGGWWENSGSRGNGGSAGGVIVVIAKEIEVTGTINAGGNNGANGGWGSGGGGAGGAVLLKAEDATLGSSLITAAKGNKGSASYAYGGDGGVGRIHLDYSNSYTGTTSPTIDVTQDSTIVAGGAGGGSFQMLMLGIG